MICKMLLPVALCLLPYMALAESDPVTREMSKRSQIPIEDLERALENCEQDQRSMNLCALRMAVSAELAFDAVQDEMAIFDPEEYAALKARTRSECQKEADLLAGGGSMVAAEVSLCIAADYRARHAGMVEIQRLEALPHPPHKWN